MEPAEAVRAEREAWKAYELASRRVMKLQPEMARARQDQLELLSQWVEAFNQRSATEAEMLAAVRREPQAACPDCGSTHPNAAHVVVIGPQQEAYCRNAFHQGGVSRG